MVELIRLEILKSGYMMVLVDLRRVVRRNLRGSKGSELLWTCIVVYLVPSGVTILLHGFYMQKDGTRRVIVTFSSDA